MVNPLAQKSRHPAGPAKGSKVREGVREAVFPRGLGHSLQSEVFHQVSARTHDLNKRILSFKRVRDSPRLTENEQISLYSHI